MSGASFRFDDETGLSKLPKPGFDGSGITANHVVDLLSAPVGDRLALQDLQDFKLLDALDVISKELSD